MGDTDKGMSIAQEMEAREEGFGNYTAEIRMVLVDSGGRERVRQLRVRTREVKGDGDQSLAIFDKPADVRGTAFLSHTHINRPDDQWLYLPSLKRVKRISPNNKTAPFMGSEFSYEDLVSYELARYTYTYVGEDRVDGAETFIIDRFPVDQYSGYSKERIWVDKNRYKPLQIDFYSRKNEKTKTLRFGDYRQYLGKYWYTHEMRMQNHVSGKSSVLYWNDYRFHQPLGDIDFDTAGLQRVR